jgi:hypothetical protein
VKDLEGAHMHAAHFINVAREAVQTLWSPWRPAARTCIDQAWHPAYTESSTRQCYEASSAVLVPSVARSSFTAAK